MTKRPRGSSMTLQKHRKELEDMLPGVPLPADSAPIDQWYAWAVVGVFSIYVRRHDPDVELGKKLAAEDCRRSWGKKVEALVLRALGDDVAADRICADKTFNVEAQRLDAILQTTGAGDRYA